MKKKTIILLWLVTAYSCSNYSSRLKTVLDYSGTNRAELEKVLDHYSQDPADSLKLKASIFRASGASCFSTMIMVVVSLSFSHKRHRRPAPLP